MKAKEIVEAIAERLLGGDVDMEGFVELAERQKADLAYWKRMIDDTGIKVE